MESSINSETMVSPKKTVSSVVSFPLKERKISNFDKEPIMKAAFRTPITLDWFMVLTATLVLQTHYIPPNTCDEVNISQAEKTTTMSNLT